MAIKSETFSVVSQDSGAFTVEGNTATLAGYATVATGVTLAAGVGTMVVPVPTLGLATVGAGLVVAGNFNEIKERFSSAKKEAAPKVKADVSEEIVA